MVRSVFRRSVTSCTSEAKALSLPSAPTSGVLYHSQWMIRPPRVALASVVLLPSPEASSSKHIASIAPRSAVVPRRAGMECPIACCAVTPKMVSAAGFHAVMRISRSHSMTASGVRSKCMRSFCAAASAPSSARMRSLVSSARA